MPHLQFSRLPRLVILVLASIAIAFGPAMHLARFAYLTGDQSYILLVPALVVMLIYRDQSAIFQDVRPGWSRTALSFFAGGLLATIGAYFLSAGSELQMAVCAVGLVACWVGAFSYSFGAESAKAATFPLAMLLWIVPIPAAGVEAITKFLQDGSTELVAILFQATGTPVLRDGYVFYLASQSIEVAKECSGIRSSLCLILLTLIIAHESLRGNVRRALLVAFTIPLVIVKNGIRIVTLTLLAVHVDPSFLTGRLHHQGGIVFFLIGMALLLPAIALLRRGDAPVREPVSARAASAV